VQRRDHPRERVVIVRGVPCEPVAAQEVRVDLPVRQEQVLQLIAALERITELTQEQRRTADREERRGPARSRAALGRGFWLLGSSRSGRGTPPEAAAPRLLDFHRGVKRCCRRKAW